MHRTAEISACGVYRYRLTRAWAFGSGLCCFIMLNPSTADAHMDDPTIRRCIGFAQGWGFESLTVLNLFALRATDPAELKRCAAPVGPENDEWIEREARNSQMIVCAWGVHGGQRGRAVRNLLAGQKLHHLGLTKGGDPKHPLYLRGDTEPTVWS